MRLFEFNQSALYDAIDKTNDTGYSTDDLVAIYLAQDGPWTDLPDENLAEAAWVDRRKGSTPPATPPPTAAPVADNPPAPKAIFKMCPLFDETSKRKFQDYPQLRKKFDGDRGFKAAKRADPNIAFGSSDKPFHHAFLKGNWHCHLTPDISLVYKREGMNPVIFNLLGIFSHDELGTGQPASIRRQEAMGVRFANQEFK